MITKYIWTCHNNSSSLFDYHDMSKNKSQNDKQCRPDQTAPTVWSGSTLSAELYLII